MKLRTLILSTLLASAAGGAAFANGGEDSNDWGPSKPDMFRDRETSSLSAPALATRKDEAIVVAPDGTVVGVVTEGVYVPKK